MKFELFIESAPDIITKKLEQLKTLRERPDYHPEPSCYEHIRIVTDRLIQTDDIDLIFCGVLHDICKYDTFKINPKSGYPTCPGHDEASYKLILGSTEIQEWISSKGGDIVIISLICLYHMRFHQLGEMRESKRQKQIEEWVKIGIWDKIQFMGAADNMLVEFDLDNLSKSFKSYISESKIY